ncbi:MAG: IclR family transcriptional regulator [Candidatus Dormibacteria bacterium]
MSELEILNSFDGGGARSTALDHTSRSQLTLSAADIISRTGLPRSSVFRDLRALVASGFVHQDAVSKRYTLGPRILELGMAARRQLSAEGVVAAPLLELVRQTSESVTFSLLDLPWRVCVYVIEAPSELRHFAQVGARYPLHLGAAGKVILAQLPPDIALATLKAHGVNRSQAAEIVGQLERIRSKGYAITSGERVAGSASAAAPVFVGGSVFGSVAVAGPTDRISPLLERYRRLVSDVADDLSSRLSSRQSDGSVASPKLRTTALRK